MDVVGQLRFPGIVLDIWDDPDEPLFLVRDVANIIYPGGGTAKTHHLLRMVSLRNILTFKLDYSGQGRLMKFINEDGLNEVFAHSNHPQARVWHQISIKRLIQLRKDQGLNFKEDVELRDRQSYEDYYFDEEEGIAYIVRKDENGETYLEEMD